MPDSSFEGQDWRVRQVHHHDAHGQNLRHRHLEGHAHLVRRAQPPDLDLAVIQVIPETPSTVSYRLERRDSRPLPQFLAGQYLSLQLSICGKRTSRACAISSSPAESKYYEITLRRIPGDPVSNYLVDNLSSGSQLRCLGPMGTLFHDPLVHGEDLVFIAVGSGVIPAKSMILDIIGHNTDRKLHLIHSAQSIAEIIFRDELDAIAAFHPNIKVNHVIADASSGWRGASGPMTAQLLAQLLGPVRDRTVFVCGPPEAHPLLLAQLHELGHPRYRVRLEASGTPVQPHLLPGWPVEWSPEMPVKVTVKKGPSFATKAGTSLLDALEEHGVQVDSACRSGKCGLCRCKVLSGEVFTPEGAGLRRFDAEQGYVHSCVTYPLSNLEIQL